MTRDGIIILDKPKDITSREACIRLKRLVGASKAGNSGTLDPNSTGVLLICLGNATKIMPALQGMDKEYIAKIHFHEDIAQNEIDSLVKKFTGEITQTPPVKSAVARKPRQRNVYLIEIVSKGSRDVELKIRCQSGTYIRKIASDMGSIYKGAHLIELRRTAVGDFRIEQSHEMGEFEEASENELERSILPIEKGVSHLKKLFLRRDSVESARLGKPLEEAAFSNKIMGIKQGEFIALMFQEKLIAIAKFDGKVFIDRVI